LAVLRPDVDGEHKLRPPRGQQIARVTEQGRTVPLQADAAGMVKLKLRAGKVYRVGFR